MNQQKTEYQDSKIKIKNPDQINKQCEKLVHTHTHRPYTPTGVGNIQETWDTMRRPNLQIIEIDERKES